MERKIEENKIYLIFDGSKTGHPGFILWANDSYNIYLIIKIGSSKNDHNFLFNLKDKNRKEPTYIYKKALLAKRKDIGKKSFTDFVFSNDEILKILSTIDTNNPAETPSIRRKDRRNFKRFYK